MAKVELRNYRKAQTPVRTLLRLFRYFKHCRLILISAVASIIVYTVATIASSYLMRPLVDLLENTVLPHNEAYAKYLALLIGLAGLYLLLSLIHI